MKAAQNHHSEKDKPIWDQLKNSNITMQSPRALPKLLVWLILFVIVTYILYTLKLVSTSHNTNCTNANNNNPIATHNHIKNTTLITNTTTLASSLRYTNQTKNLRKPHERTEIKDVVFGIAASAKLWQKRKEYIKLWYKPEEMRGIVWLDKQVRTNKSESLPTIKISSDTSKFPYRNRQGDRSAIRISRIVSETLRLGMKDVRWFVMGDDDTVFVTENLLRVLRKYDHNQYYYIGSLSESHLQNIFFSYGMAYGGGGFAISYPLAKALDKIQDRCIKRYPGLYGSDDRMQACMAELGIPLTKELGFHQYDVYGNLLGLLSAHPVAPLVSVHHLDVVEPIFPNMTRVQALQHLMVPMKLDSAGLIQQSICYDKAKGWTVTVSWGFVVQVFRGIFSPREMEMPSRTFLNWYKRADYTAYAFNTRPVARNPCQKPFIFYMSNAVFNSTLNSTVTEYSRHRIPHPACRWKMTNPGDINTIVVYKKPDPQLWDREAKKLDRWSS